ncbi:MAG: helix-turn-helix domain-containing protein [Oscillospiraceae bacterium]|nr:helix-turn-helix domain-containing protein [Oscillospiraceae bacterium]
MYTNRIKAIRKEKGITLSSLAKLTGVSAGYLCHLEKGTRKNPSIEVMNNIAAALDKTIAEVFFE